jgi:gamma-glutamyltranspeptidase/glutathione hydrolase
VSASPLAASTGLQVLQNGGNAFDAAVAMAAAECVCLPGMCGLGGEAFAILYQASTREFFGINSSGAAPLSISPEFFWDKDCKLMPTDGPLSSAVPGEVAALGVIADKFGTMPLSDLLIPAMQFAESGFAVPHRLAQSLSQHMQKISKYPATSEIFTKESTPYAYGDILLQRDLAESLKSLANGGVEEFYAGPLGAQIVDEIRRAGGLFTVKDFESHSVDLYEPPISTDYRGFTVYETRPPSQGFMLLEMLNILEGFNLSSYKPLSPEAIHLMVEVKKLVYADRNAHASYPDFAGTNLDELISKAYAESRKRNINLSSVGAHLGDHSSGNDNGMESTSYLCVVDASGNAVSFIHSLSNLFGSGWVAGDTGILMNNRVGRGFSLEENHPNLVGSGRKTMHTLNCYMVAFAGQPLLVGGTPGGDFQIQANLQVITNMLDFGLDAQEAVDAPRWNSVPGTDPATLYSEAQINVEKNMPAESVEKLVKMGHSIEILDDFGVHNGAVQLISIDANHRTCYAVSDYRADGQALIL